MTEGYEDFERCPACRQGLEPRVLGDHLETVEEPSKHGDAATAAAMVCPNPDCPTKQPPEHAGTP